MSTNIIWFKGAVRTQDREKILGQKGCVIWLTGLPGSGKSTIAALLERTLISSGRTAFLLDGDNLRHGLCSDLTFTADDRHENIRRVSEVAKLFADSGLITITAFISPYEADRKLARSTIGTQRFIETYVDAPLTICESRDPKGHWKLARSGGIQNFTGIDSPFEIPKLSEIHLNTDKSNPSECVSQIMQYITPLIIC